MITTGTLKVSSGVSRLNGTRLARQGENDPFAAATNFLANRGLGNNAFIRVDGNDGFVGSVPVIFVVSAGSGALGGMIAMTASKAIGAGSKASRKATKPVTKKPAAKKRTAKKSTGKRTAAKSVSTKTQKRSRKR
jgi:hypothetical protein